MSDASLSTPHPDSPDPKPPTRFRDRVRQRVGEQDLLVVRIGDERFGVPLDSVDQLVESPRLRTVPSAPESLLGVFTLGADMLPLYSPAAVLGASPGGERIALVMRGGRSRLALAVDDADDVVRIELGQVRDAPRAGQQDDLVLGVFWREGSLVALVDARALIAAYATQATEAA